MRTPPSRLEQHEQVLSSMEIAELSCTQIARKIASGIAIIVTNEVVSRSDEFGYIYRYDIAEPVEDASGEIHRVEAGLVLWSEDCETFKIRAYSKFKLQETLRRARPGNSDPSPEPNK